MTDRRRTPALLTVLASLSITACSTTVSPTYTYRPAGDSDSARSISGRAKERVFKHEVAILVNGSRVTGGELTELKPKANFSAVHNGHKLLAECELTDPSGPEMIHGHQCDIFIDNERATTLEF